MVDTFHFDPSVADRPLPGLAGERDLLVCFVPDTAGFLALDEDLRLQGASVLSRRDDAGGPFVLRCNHVSNAILEGRDGLEDLVGELDADRLPQLLPRAASEYRGLEGNAPGEGGRKVNGSPASSVMGWNAIPVRVF